MKNDRPKGYKPDDLFSKAIRDGLKSDEAKDPPPTSPENVHDMVKRFKNGASAESRFAFDLEKDKRDKGIKKI